MKVFMTGATGYIGSTVSDALSREGHEVTGLARSGSSADDLAARGHRVTRGNLREPEGWSDAAGEADAVVHVGNTGDEDAGEVDAGVVEAVLDALEGSEKPFVYTSGIWVLGDIGEAPADEDAPTDPSPLVAWRPALEEKVIDAASRGVGGVVVRPAIVHGRGGGIPAMLVEEARESGGVRVVGDGRQEWPMVHVDDLADLYGRLLDAPAGSLYHGADGPSWQARDLAAAAGIAAGGDGRVEPWSLEEAREALGPFADALALSQRVSGRRARDTLGWTPEGPSVIQELLAGSYAGSA